MRVQSLVRSMLALALGASLADGLGAQSLDTVRLASGLSSPLFATAPPGDFARLFIVEQTGRIKILKNGAVLATPFLNISTLIVSGGERGLLGLAFHPDYSTNGHFYVNYTRAGDGATIVARYTVSANPDIANAASAATVLGPIAQPFTNHNGGCIQFGPDDYLYIGTGDGGSAGDPSCRAQSGGTLLGKMLRIDVDGGSPYAIPASNPFVGDPNFLDEIWAYGLRNPWRFSFDRSTGDLYTGDVGQNAVEEIDFQPGGSAGGENYGWKIMEGNNCYSTTACTAPPPCFSPLFTDPIHTYSHAGGACSVTGGYVYRGCAIPSPDGAYFFADYCSSQIFSFKYVAGSVTQFTNQTANLAPGGGLSIGSITSFGEDAMGELYICDQGGEVFKVVPSPLTDCNGNFVEDSCDIAFGTSADVNSNGIPDECECTTSDICQPTAPDLTDGCTPDVSWIGWPDVTQCNTPGPSDFVITFGAMSENKNANITVAKGAPVTGFWSLQSTRCFAPPYSRTGIQDTGDVNGAPGCGGQVALDVEAYLQGGNPLLTPALAGDTYVVQTWYRDPFSTKTTQMTDAATFTVCP